LIKGWNFIEGGEYKMLLGNKVRIGIAPTKRSFLSLEEAVRQKNKIYEKISNLMVDQMEIVGIEGVVPEGVLWELDEVEEVVMKFKENKIDGLFIPHCDFGTEEVVGRLAKEMKLPTLLWGPRDEEPNTAQKRGRDTQCGIFASSKVLQRYGVKFSYIVNSETDGDDFSEGFMKFVRVVSVVKSFKTLRIAQIGNRPKPFMSVICNEGELLNKFGIETIPLFVSDIVNSVLKMIQEDTDELKKEIEDIKGRINCDKIKEEALKKIAALKLTVSSLAKLHECSAVAIECWTLFPKILGIVPCFAVSELTDMGLPVACETDINGAITSVMLQAAALGESATFFADLTIRHPENDNAELLWHCGPFPYSLKDEKSEACLNEGRAEWKLKKGDLTIARFDELNGQYSLFVGEGTSIDGPKTTGTYTWMEVNDWKRWEEKFIFGPYIHHVAGVYGQFRQVLVEACKYISGLCPDTIGDNPLSL
jgi:L-fucose isomerase-like protein